MQPNRNPPIYRLATTHDTDALVTLINAAYRGDTSRQGWTTEADLLGGQRTDPGEIAPLIEAANSLFLLAECGSSLVGCLHLQKDPDGVVWLGMFAIQPGKQGVGLGKDLLAQAEGYAGKPLLGRRLKLSVIDVRTELIAFYQRRGFVDTGEKQPFPEHDPRFGLPKRSGLRFAVLEKRLSPQADP